MSIKRSIATKITNAINVAFKKIGTSNGTLLPPAPKQKNTEPLVWDYHVASQLLRVATARKKEAFEECVKAGVVTDTDKHPLPEGTKETVFTGTAVSISVNVKTARLTLDADKFVEELVLHGIDKKLVDDCRALASKRARPAHEYSTSLLTSDD